MAWPRFNNFSFWLYLVASLSVRVRLLQGRIRPSWTTSFFFISYGLVICVISSILLFISLFYPITIKFSGLFFSAFFIIQLITFPFIILSHFFVLEGFNLFIYVLVSSKLEAIYIFEFILFLLSIYFFCYMVILGLYFIYCENYSSFHHWRRFLKKFFETHYHRINGNLDYHNTYLSMKNSGLFSYLWLVKILLWLLVIYYIVPMFMLRFDYSFLLLGIPVDFGFAFNPARFLLYVIFLYRLYKNFPFLKKLYNSIKLKFFTLWLNAQYFDPSDTKVKGLKFYILWFLSKFHLRQTYHSHRIVHSPTHVYLICSFNFCVIEDKSATQSMIYSFNKNYLKPWDRFHPEYSIYRVSFYDLQGNFVRNVNFDWELFTHINHIDITYESSGRLFADWLFERSSEACTANPNLISAVKYQNLVERAA